MSGQDGGAPEKPAPDTSSTAPEDEVLTSADVGKIDGADLVDPTPVAEKELKDLGISPKPIPPESVTLGTPEDPVVYPGGEPVVGRPNPGPLAPHGAAVGAAGSGAPQPPPPSAAAVEAASDAPEPAADLDLEDGRNLIENVAAILGRAGIGILQGASTDISKYGLEIAKRLVEAAATGNLRRKQILIARLATRAELLRVRTNAATLEAFRGVVAEVWIFLRDCVAPELLGKSIRYLEHIGEKPE